MYYQGYARMQLLVKTLSYVYAFEFCKLKSLLRLSTSTMGWTGSYLANADLYFAFEEKQTTFPRFSATTYIILHLSRLD